MTVHKLRDRVRWCIILSFSQILKKYAAGDFSHYVPLLKQANYQRVLNRRPLFFILDDNTPALTVRPALAEFRRGCVAAGAGDPYTALMSWQPAATLDKVKQAGADAISAYSINHPKVTSSFEDLDKAVRAQWEAMRRTVAPCIPLAVTGEDRRPRIEHPVPWEAAQQKPGEGREQYYIAGTPTQIAAQIRAMVDWIAAAREACPTQCGIIYSWDECDEGGSTLLPTLGGGEAILHSVGKALRDVGRGDPRKSQLSVRG